MTPRYKGKPFLRLLELYVLQAIGELTDDNKELLRQMTPNLRNTYNSPELSWDQIIEKEMRLPNNFKDLVLMSWNKNFELALKNGEVLKSEDFAQMFVDANLV